MRIEILPEAGHDLIAGFRFYERQAPGLGSYFREFILSFWICLQPIRQERGELIAIFVTILKRSKESIS